MNEDTPLSGPKKNTMSMITEYIGDPWSQQLNEPDDLYVSFCSFRDAGTDRTVVKAQAIHSDRTVRIPKSRRGPASMRQASTKWCWVDRAQKWDVMMARKLGAINEDTMIEHEKSKAIVMRNIMRMLQDATESQDLKRITHTLSKLKFLLSTIRAGDYLIGVHRAIHGDKHQVEQKKLVLQFDL
jgi:hypothetical protein